MWSLGRLLLCITELAFKMQFLWTPSIKPRMIFYFPLLEILSVNSINRNIIMCFIVILYLLQSVWTQIQYLWYGGWLFLKMWSLKLDSNNIFCPSLQDIAFLCMLNMYFGCRAFSLCDFSCVCPHRHEPLLGQTHSSKPPSRTLPLQNTN